MHARSTRTLRLIAVLALLPALLACAPMQRAWDAALLLTDLHAGTEDSALKRRTDPPSVQIVQYAVDGQTQIADRYQGPVSPRGSLVLIHGFTEEGRRDPRLVAFAHSLARSGFRVLAPELPGLTDMRFGSTVREEIATALRFATHGGDVIGLAAMSLAAGPALLAATEPDIADRIGYLVLVGGYYDIADVISYATTGVEGSDGRRAEVARPMRQGKWMLLLAQLHHFDRSADRTGLRAIAERKLQNEEAPVQDWLEKLSDGARATLALIVNTDPQQVAPLIARLPDGVRAELAAINPAQHDISGLKARLLLIHGAQDPVIPVSQSKRLAQAVPEGQATLVVPPQFDHVNLEAGLVDAWYLWCAAWKLLALADQQRGAPSADVPSRRVSD